MITGYNNNDNITIMNTLYTYPRKQEDGKYLPDQISILYKDNNTGLKHVEEIQNPTYQYYMAKEDVYLQTPEFFIDKDKVEMIEVPYTDLTKSIAENTDNLQFFYDNLKSGNRYANNELHTHPRIFRSDSNIEDHYRMRFDRMYVNDICPISKSYLDIETELRKTIIDNNGNKKRISCMMGDFPEPGECPVNAVSYVSEKTKEIYVFLLRNKDNPLVEQFERSIGPDLFAELKDFIKKTVGGKKKFMKFKLDQFDFKFIFYDEEVNLLIDLFNLINMQEPDFLLVWNMAFDIPYLIQRLINLGVDPRDVICSREFKNKECEYYIDERNKNEFAERGDFAKISCKIIYIDQMIQFASRRKGQGVYQSYRLDSIGQDVVGVRKLDYSHITTDLGELPYLDYKTFVFYNIVDTIVQYCIEFKTGDINYIFGKCIINNTRYQKGHRQTVYLTNRAGKMFEDQDFIIGNNQNKHNEKESYGGGLVGDPSLINDYSRLCVNSRYMNIYDNLDDYDFKSLYPSLAREFNLAPNTQIGKLMIDTKVFDYENPYNDPLYERGGDFLDNLQSEVYIEICKRWFNLASFTDIFNDIREYFEEKQIPRFSTSELYSKNNEIHPIHYMKNRELEYDPIIRYNNDIESIDKLFLGQCNNTVINNIEFVDFSRVSEYIGGNQVCRF